MSQGKVDIRWTVWPFSTQYRNQLSAVGERPSATKRILIKCILPQRYNEIVIDETL
jgi:hypothetical protein